MPSVDPFRPADDRDLLVSDLVTGRWTVAARLSHRDTGARRTECPTCYGGGIVPTRQARPVPTDVEPTIGDLLAGRWTSRARRLHRTTQAAFVSCDTCHGSGSVPADLDGTPRPVVLSA